MPCRSLRASGEQRKANHQLFIAGSYESRQCYGASVRAQLVTHLKGNVFEGILRYKFVARELPGLSNEDYRP